MKVGLRFIPEQPYVHLFPNFRWSGCPHMTSVMQRQQIQVCIVACIFLWSVQSPAAEIPPPAYQLAAHAAGVPSPVLYAIALQESGIQIRGQLRPWPWTLNVAGKPLRYRSYQAACAGLTEAMHHVPSRQIDVGLGQINVGHQAHRGVAPCDLLDPYRNLALAATILREQYRPREDWLHAIGRYHRPVGGAPAARYRRDVQRHLNRVLGPAYPITIIRSSQ